jgi:cystathionine beta-lyase/cystathionine gamma-synthase
VDTSNLDLIAPAITPRTKYLFLESPTNPLLRITDLAAASDIAHRHGVRVIVDNTFASPYMQRPLELGADIVVHSTTKFLNGHSDSVGGIVVVRHADDEEWMRFVQNAAGAISARWIRGWCCAGPRPSTSGWSEPMRNAMALAEFLAGHPKVTETIYPGLTSHPQHKLARRADARVRRADLVRHRIDRRGHAAARARPPAGPGGEPRRVETLISHPAVMTHASVPPERRAAIGISDGLVRISVGIEDVDDLKADLTQALA